MGFLAIDGARGQGSTVIWWLRPMPSRHKHRRMARGLLARQRMEPLLELQQPLRLTQLSFSSLRTVVRDTSLLKATLATGTTSTRGTLGELVEVAY